MRRLLLGLGIVLLVAGIAVAVLKPRPLLRDAPRDFPWPVPDHRAAQVAHEVLPDGRVQMRIEHLPLPGIAPEMLAWWYRVLPISTVRIGATTYPLYHIFHLTEHGRIWVAEPASDGAPGMGVGALVAREEWFGPHDSAGAGRVTELSAAGMTVRPEVAGVALGEIRHDFSSTANGSRYTVHSLIGVDWPLLGPLVNQIVRLSFHDAMLREWERHQVEEVAMLRYYLPQLYAQRARTPDFELPVPHRLE